MEVAHHVALEAAEKLGGKLLLKSSKHADSAGGYVSQGEGLYFSCNTPQVLSK